MKKTANAFGVSCSSVSVIIRRVCQAVSEHKGPTLICLPKTETEVKEKVTKFFNHWLFQQCLGAVDGEHIDIKQPSYNSTDFINPKGQVLNQLSSLL